MGNIVCLSTSNYHPYPTRKQNVMNRLQHAEIIYFDPPISYLAPLKDRSLKPRLRAWRRGGEQVGEHLTVYALPPVLPFGSRYRWLNRLNQRRQARYIRQVLAEQGFSRPLLWCYSPTAADLVGLLPHGAVVYDCVDRHSAYPGMINAQVVDNMERKLAEQADQVFCTAAGLYDTLIRYNPHTALIPNGVAYELFVQAAGPKRSEGPPRFCFVGMLQDCIAYDYLLALADAFPKAEIWLIGRAMPGVDTAMLAAKPNIRLLGLRPQQELPELISACDVCLNLFAPSRLSQDVSPLKFYEYLATGKPVVSTNEPLQVRDYADLVYIAEDIDDFLAKCGRALAEDDPALRQRRMAAGQAAGWDNRVRQMEAILAERGLLDQSVARE